ncbi:MAG: type VI secretion system tip protein VgrG [Myxococcales bacterium]|nr:type VI secretion system tip protein VgrG [Myxococcales bacterium]
MFLDTRQVSVISALGPGAFQLRRFGGNEKLGEPFSWVLDLRSENHNIRADKILGTEMVLELELPNLAKRQFTGFVIKFAYLGMQGRFAAYRATLGPFLSLMQLKSDCRIFQDRPVPDIVAEVCESLGIPVAIEMKLSGHKTRPYTVQYRESDFNFVSRLLVDEGIYYHFRHTGGRHSLVLIDAAAKHEPVPGYLSIPFYPPTRSGRREEEHISSWDLVRQVVPGNAALQDYDYEYKQVALGMAMNDPQGHANDHLEVFDYPGGYLTDEDGRQAIGVALERLQSRRELIAFETTARGLYAGATFRVRNLPDVSESEEFLAVEAHYSIESDALESSSDAAAEMVFQARFTAMSAKRQFRPALPASVQKPQMRGPHSAIVTGPPETEIYTDPSGLGRVLVQFHWDRYAQASEKHTSCWVRVSQPWAGGGFGFVQIPRVGEEVLVDFLDGDPDRPVIVGRLYNGKNKPPYKLPDNATQSGWKSRSSPKGHADNFNEIRFEDKKGQEELHVQAERNHSVYVKADQSIRVDGNRAVTVHKNEEIAVQGERKTTVTKKDEQYHVDTRYTQVMKTDELEVFEKHTETFHDGQKKTVEKSDDETFVKGASKTTTVDKQFNLNAQEHIHLEQKGTQLFLKDAAFIGSDGNIEITNNGVTIVADSQGGGLLLEAKQQIELKCGAASLIMSMDGTITLKGAVAVQLQLGPNAVALTPAGTDIKGALVNVTGSALVAIAGPIIKVG